MTTHFEDFDPATQMKIGTDCEFGEQYGRVSLTMPTLCALTPLHSKYGINENFGQNGKFPLEVNISSSAATKLRLMEDKIKETFAAHSRTWFQGKDKTSSYTFSPLVKDTDDGQVLKLKVKDGTNLYLLTEDGKAIQKSATCTFAHVNRTCTVVPFVQSYSMWIDTKNHFFGVTLTAKILLVHPGLDEDPVESMLLKSGYVYAE